MAIRTGNIIVLGKLSLIAVLVAACGSKSKSVGAVVPGSANGLNTQSTCNKSDCPPATPDFGATTSPGGALVGFTNEPVNWTVFGVDSDTKKADGTGSARRMTVLLDKIPEGATLSPGKGDKLSSQVNINYTPTAESTGKKADVIIRDADRCEADHGSDGYCDSYKFLSDYDKRFEGALPWVIQDRSTVAAAQANIGAAGAAVKVSDPNCTGAAPATTNSQITTSAITTLMKGLLGGPAGLAGLGVTLFSSGALSGGNKTQPTPNPC